MVYPSELVVLIWVGGGEGERTMTNDKIVYDVRFDLQ